MPYRLCRLAFLQKCSHFSPAIATNKVQMWQPVWRNKFSQLVPVRGWAPARHQDAFYLLQASTYILFRFSFFATAIISLSMSSFFTSCYTCVQYYWSTQTAQSNKFCVFEFLAFSLLSSPCSPSFRISFFLLETVRFISTLGPVIPTVLLSILFKETG